MIFFFFFFFFFFVGAHSIRSITITQTEQLTNGITATLAGSTAGVSGSNNGIATCKKREKKKIIETERKTRSIDLYVFKIF